MIVAQVASLKMVVELSVTPWACDKFGGRLRHVLVRHLAAFAVLGSLGGDGYVISIYHAVKQTAGVRSTMRARTDELVEYAKF